MALDPELTKDWLDFEQFKEKYQKVPVEEYPNNVLEAIPEPVVSVHIITYQHVDYIRDAIEGVLMQKTDFPFEIIIGDDESNDGTREICIEYAEKYPDKIRLFLHKRENNIAILGKPSHIFQYSYNSFNLRGKYVAGCSGDDYWTDPLKLQKQVEFMEGNEGYSMCFTDYSVIDSGNNIIDEDPLQNEEKCSRDLVDILGYKRLPQALTVLIRASSHPTKFPSDFFKIISEDKFIYSLVCSQGKAFFMDFKSGYYRMHIGAINSMKSTEYRLKHAINTNKKLKNIFKEKRESRAINYQNIKYYNTLFSIYYNEKRVFKFICLNLNYIQISPLALLKKYKWLFLTVGKNTTSRFKKRPG